MALSIMVNIISFNLFVFKVIVIIRVDLILFDKKMVLLRQDSLLNLHYILAGTSWGHCPRLADFLGEAPLI